MEVHRDARPEGAPAQVDACSEVGADAAAETLPPLRLPHVDRLALAEPDVHTG